MCGLIWVPISFLFFFCLTTCDENHTYPRHVRRASAIASAAAGKQGRVKTDRLDNARGGGEGGEVNVRKHVGENGK